MFADFIRGAVVDVWCDNKAAVSILNSGRGKDPVLQAVARNLWLEAARLDCDVHFTHIRGANNHMADLLSRCRDHPNPTACLFQLLNGVPVWIQEKDGVWDLDNDI
jgi:hypothetical protein